MRWINNVITAVLLICNVVPMSSNKETYCYGDICNKATDNQFCSEYFKMCRNCADIIMDCGTEQQPSACTPYCINYKVELELQRKQDSNCSVSSTMLNITVNTTHTQQDGTVGVACEDGYEPHFTNTAQCGEFGIFRFSSPTCEGWYNVGCYLVATCVALFILAVVLISANLWQHHQRIKLIKQMKETSRINSGSSAESGIDVNEVDGDETSPMMKNGHFTVIDEKDKDSNYSVSGKEASNPGRPVDVTPSAPPPTDCSSESSPSGVTNHNTNFTYYNLNGNITLQTDNVKTENNDDKNDYKPDRKQPEEEHVPEKTPTEESQTTVVALQETKDRTCKGARPIIDCSDTDIALDSVPKCLKKLHVDDCS
ncbi:uncharacterized protein LOC128556262 isoform X3 [Mercenaria mercenaria]|uniref:uncharacterized protein LOC128556262 isoform X3 n=1 Tax=Mercenaria mercenaria TaxID=6596 RepID=UPI00234EBBAE|nr:uncharacterized protein LOC128556262 isoform X3 [Mercenaria mercenaria]